MKNIPENQQPMHHNQHVSARRISLANQTQFISPERVCHVSSAFYEIAESESWSDLQCADQLLRWIVRNNLGERMIADIANNHEKTTKNSNDSNNLYSSGTIPAPDG